MQKRFKISPEGRALLPSTVWRFSVAAVLWLLTLAAGKIFMSSQTVADAYAEVMKLVVLILSGAMSYVPFVVAEVLLYLCVMIAAIYIVIQTVLLITRRGKPARGIRIVADIAMVSGVISFAFLMLFGYSYHCTPVSERMELDVHEQPITMLYDTTEWLLGYANEYAAIVPRDGEGQALLGTFDGIADRMADGYTTLSADWRFLQSTYAPVKRVSSWWLMSYVGITGIYVPFTAESVVNPDCAAATLPFTMAHEMAHRLTIAREEEANFLAFLSCRANSDRRIQYSGYYMAFRYCFVALYNQNPELGMKLYNQMVPELKNDMDEHDVVIAKYDTPVRDVGDKVNDTYLKVNNQTAGVNSYGQVVDLLIALYRKEVGR
ncbi:MAG: DUF3810 domain-containing protein [Clostridia bacterium]|nr:DUF3810 domain-containing protein [Clostridia bacterium]